MPSLDEELRDIAELADIEAVKKRKSARKGQLTRLSQQIRAFDDVPYLNLKAKEVERRANEARRATALHDALQDRHEALLEAEPDALAEEMAQGLINRQEYERLSDKVEALLDKVLMHREATIILEDLQPLLESDAPDRPVYQTTFNTLKPLITSLKRKAGEYTTDPDVTAIVTGINRAVAKFQQKAAEAQKRSVSPPPKPSATVVESPSTEPTRTITISSRLRLDLPKFNGDPTEWINFKALFTAAMDRDGAGISDQEKCTHLLACMTNNSARQTVKQFATTSDGYKHALQALEDVYGGAWRIYPQHVAALLRPDTYSYTSDSLRKMRELIDTNLKGLEQCGGATLPQFLAAMIISRFDKQMTYEWSHHWDDMETLPTINEVRDFFRKRELRMIEQPSTSVRPASNKPAAATNKAAAQQKKNYPLPVRAVTGSTATSQTSFQCVACKQEGHTLMRCPTFISMTPEKRQKVVREAKYCFNCLNHAHQVKDCQSPYTCRVCNTKHHTLLHRDGNNSTSNTNTNTTNTNQAGHSDGSVMVTYGNTGDGEPSILSTAKFTAYNGRLQQAGRALLDSGSVPSLVTEALADALKLPRTPCVKVFACAAGDYLRSKHKVTLNICPLDQTLPDETVAVVCHVVKQLPTTIPPDDPNILLTPQQQQGRVPVADPTLGGDIDILLGVSDSSRCHRGARIYTDDMAGYVAPTIFGWILGGRLPGAPINQTVLCVQPAINPLDAALQQLWSMDQTSDSSTAKLSEEEVKAVVHFKDNHHQLPDGRFVVSLPRKEHPPTLGASRPTALRRFLRNEKTLKAKGQLSAFNAVLQEYLDLEHAEVVPQDQLSIPSHLSFYLPVHGVTKESSTTTRLRAVFDASCKSSSGVSLNDTLLPGPNLYPLLTTVLNRFRLHQVAFSADISKMFREVLLDPSDRDFHRFIYRNDSGNIMDCRMLRLTFGVTSSPYLASQVLLQLAELCEAEYPEAAATIRSAFYVDDCLTGARSVAEAEHLVKQLINSLSSIGMMIRKFRSNSSDLLQTIPTHLQESSDLEIKDPRSSAKTLGIHWHTTEDCFYVAVPIITSEQTATKRLVASTAARVFDILGLYSPVTIVAKMSLQQLWRLHLDWDQEAPEHVNQLWHQWTSELSFLSSNPVSRKLIPCNLPVLSLQLHGFSDASEKAYGAVVYLRVIYHNMEVSVSLVMSKARVTPVKTVTIPRLELSAALLLAKLMQMVASDLDIPLQHCYAWTDSSVVLSWLSHSPASLKTFEANRVATIQRITTRGQWRHVRSATNPADLASRGATAIELLNSTLWWSGPPWLKLPPEEWPHLPLSKPTDRTAGFKAQPVAMAMTSPPWETWSRYSSFSRLTRIIAWLKRFTKNCSTTSESRNLTPHLSAEEIQDARTIIIKCAQVHSYLDVLEWINKKQPLPPYHLLSKYDVRLNPQGLLEISGRVRQVNSQLPRSQLPLHLNSPITKLMIASLHQTLHHPGTSTMLGILAETYYIPGIRNHLKQLGRNCVSCQKALCQPTAQRMGLLPASRTTPSPAFDKTGVDFAGPFLITRGNPRKPTRVKAYCVIFICFVTRAVHLELCVDLSTEAFVATFRRFCARRGTPTHLFSDNGSNFVGARKEIAEIQAMMEHPDTLNKLSHLSTNQQFQWHLTPPRAPHFGGLWEAGVKSMKILLRKNLSTRPLSYDELETILVEMEAVLNSRPTEPIASVDPDSAEVLTSGHFLIGRPLLAPPSTRVDTTTKLSLLRRWNYVQRTIHDLWLKWKATYFQSLKARTKWQKESRNFESGDIVLLKDDSLETRTWPLAVVVRTYPGSDGLVRAVDLRCGGSTYRRATNRLVLLVKSDSKQDTPPSSAPGGCLGPAQRN